MKRLCSIIMVLLLCLAMTVPVFAAEGKEEYVFDSVTRIDDIMLPGDYVLTVEANGRKETVPIILETWNFKDDEIFCRYYLDCRSIPFFNDFFQDRLIDGVRLHVRTRHINNPDLVGTEFYFYNADFDASTRLGLPENYIFRFVPVGPPVSGDSAVYLADYISPESFSSLLDQIIALLPVVLAVIVGYIALRKAIAWLMSVMRSS